MQHLCYCPASRSTRSLLSSVFLFVCSVSVVQCFIILLSPLMIVKCRPMSRESVGATLSLNKEGYSDNNIVQNTGVTVRSLRRWVYRLSNTNGKALPREATPPGRPRKTHPRTLNAIKRDAEKCPSISARVEGK